MSNAFFERNRTKRWRWVNVVRPASPAKASEGQYAEVKLWEFDLSEKPCSKKPWWDLIEGPDPATLLIRTTVSLAQLKLFGCFAFLQLIYMAFSTTLESKQLRISPIVTTSSEVLGFDKKEALLCTAGKRRVKHEIWTSLLCCSCSMASLCWSIGVDGWCLRLAVALWFILQQPMLQVGWLGTLTKCVSAVFGKHGSFIFF